MPAGHNEQPAFDELCMHLPLDPSDLHDEVSQVASDLDEAILEITSLEINTDDTPFFMRFEGFSSEDEN
jgi:hypothetical protein